MNDFAVVILVNINNKQLLDEVFVISRIIKVEVGVSQSRPWVVTVNRPRRGSQCNIG